MSKIPDGWKRHRVLLSGYGRTYTNHLEFPIENIVFATIVSVQNVSGGILAIDSLNTSTASTVDAFGTPHVFRYLWNSMSASVSNPTDWIKFPTCSANGYITSSLTVRWLGIEGGASLLVKDAMMTIVEIDLWSKS